MSSSSAERSIVAETGGRFTNGSSDNDESATAGAGREADSGVANEEASPERRDVVVPPFGLSVSYKVRFVGVAELVDGTTLLGAGSSAGTSSTAGASITGPGTIAPGMTSSHYAPKADLRLNAGAPRAGEALLAFGAAPAHAGATLNLSPEGDLVEAAANLFSHLRALDASGARHIAVMTIPHEGLGEAINDRLARAAAPKP